MNSGYPAEFIQGGGGGGSGRGGGLVRRGDYNQVGYREQRDPMLQDEIGGGRVDLLRGKRSFGEYQSYQHPLSYLHQQQLRLQQLQQSSSQNPILLRSVKQRTTNNINVHLSSFNNNNNININPFISSDFSNHENNNNIIHSSAGFGSGSGSGSGAGDSKILNTLQELEKHLLEDDDFGVADDPDGDAVSGITNSEWSQTFQNIMGFNPSLNPSPNPNPVNNINNNVISPSPTSSTSSCCSTSAPVTSSPPLRTATTAATASARELITEAATAISDGKNDVAMEVISKLEQISNLNGNSEERLSYYMCNALKSRACTTENQKLIDELLGTEQMSATYSLSDISPCFKFGILAANLVMLEAITSAMQEGMNIQIIDFDVGRGGQYVNLLRALAERKTSLPWTGMRITVVGTELGDAGVPESVKDGIVALAERVGIDLRYESVTRPIHELTRESLGCIPGEAVVVNFAFKLYRVPDESVSMENLRDELLRRVKGLSPRAVTLVEQDMNGNTAPVVTRVNEARDYYGALFDSFEATLPRDNPDRCRVEKGLGRKMVNSVAFEGRERLERAEVFGKWRARMGMAGFELKAISQSVAESMRFKLNSGRGGNPGFTVKEESGGVGFGWMGRNLTVASAWH